MRAALLLACAGALLAAGCGSAGRGGDAARGGSAARGAFSWLRPAPPPARWHEARLPSGAVLAYPAGWRPLRSDAGTRSAALLDRHGAYLGYLNATPRQSTETLANWARFRPAHNREEGDRAVRVLATAWGLRFRGGRGSCVRDSYRTQTGARFVEVACLVAGARTTVIVAAAPPGSWRAEGATLERAIGAFGA